MNTTDASTEILPLVLQTNQQVVDRYFEKNVDWFLKSNNGRKKLLLLDEPTGNTDLQRSLNFLHELDEKNSANGNEANFVVATNDGLLAVHRNIPRIDLSHPERGVHFLRDYPLDPQVSRSLADFGYVPTN